jgi:hypothetical protein
MPCICNRVTEEPPAVREKMEMMDVQEPREMQDQEDQRD